MANPYSPTQELDRRKYGAALVVGAILGALAGALAAAFALDTTFAENAGLLVASALMGAPLGAALGQGIASSVDLGPWEPLSAGRSYVGTRAPDEPAPG
jgi:hypothetical protein